MQCRFTYTKGGFLLPSAQQFKEVCARCHRHVSGTCSSRRVISLCNEIETTMKGMNLFDAEGLVAIGTLEKLQSLRPKPNQAAGLPGDIPVLTCPVPSTDAHCLASNYSQSRFGFGRIQLEDGWLMTIRLQLGDLQIYWLAEMTDPEVWAAIDMWRGGSTRSNCV